MARRRRIIIIGIQSTGSYIGMYLYIGMNDDLKSRSIGLVSLQNNGASETTNASAASARIACVSSN